MFSDYLHTTRIFRGDQRTSGFTDPENRRLANIQDADAAMAAENPKIGPG
jgi:hypothetical protein